MSDRDLEGLKGKVKLVESWSEDAGANGKPLRKPEVMTSDTYDEQGNQIASTSYYTGERNTYFTLDGERVSKSERITNDPRVIIQGMATIETPGGNEPRDKRYDSKYKYEYDQNGKIIQWSKYMNDGKLWTVRKYVYDSIGRLVSEKGAIEGRPRYEEILKYDSNGNEVESTYIDYVGADKETSYFRYGNYRLDKAGKLDRANRNDTKQQNESRASWGRGS